MTGHRPQPKFKIGDYVLDKRSPSVTWKVDAWNYLTDEYTLVSIGLNNQAKIKRPGNLLKLDPKI